MPICVDDAISTDDIKDLNRGLDEITHNKRLRVRAVNRFEKTVASGTPRDQAIRDVLRNTSIQMDTNQGVRYEAAVKAAGVELPQTSKEPLKTVPKPSPVPPRTSEVPTQTVHVTSESSGTERTWLKPILLISGIVLGILLALWLTPIVAHQYHGDFAVIGITATVIFAALVIATVPCWGGFLADALQQRSNGQDNHTEVQVDSSSTESPDSTFETLQSRSTQQA